MNKALFFRKCSNSKEYDHLFNSLSDFGQTISFKIVKSVILNSDEYNDFLANFLIDRNYISKEKEKLTINEDDSLNCLFITNDSVSGYLVYPSGYDYARYVAYYKGGE